MKAEELKVEHIEAIIGLYDSCVGPANTIFIKAESVLEDIQKHRVYEGYSIGSRWAPRSRLTFRTDNELNVVPEFGLNVDSRYRDTTWYREAQKAGELFEKESLEYLANLDQGENI